MPVLSVKTLPSACFVREGTDFWNGSAPEAEVKRINGKKNRCFTLLRLLKAGFVNNITR